MQVQVIVASFVDGEIQTKTYLGSADDAEIEQQQIADAETFANDDETDFSEDYIEELWSRVNRSLRADNKKLFLAAAVSGLYMGNSQCDETGGVVYTVCDDHHAAVCLNR